MAVDLQNRDSLLLPSQFLTEENDILSMKSKPSNPNSSTSCFGSCDFGSAMSSPVESELGSTESESDHQDDDYIGELTRQMAHYMLQDNDIKHEQSWSMAASPSPQPVLCTRLGSSQEEVPFLGNFEKLQINEEKYKYNKNERLLCTSLKHTAVPLMVRKPNGSSVEFQSKQALIDEQIRAIQIMKQQHQSLYWGKQANCYKQIKPKQQSRCFQTKGRAYGGYSNGQKASSWVNLQQQQSPGSEMRAVFLSDPGSRTACGTGVFLPRGIGNTSETRKKSRCSTVLIPARVVQALKLHFDKMGTKSKSSGAAGLCPFQYDALTGDVRYDLTLREKNKSKTVPAMSYHQETALPQEWMY